MAKPATLMALIAVAATLEPRDEAMRVWFVAALVLSLCGDVLLMLPRDLFVAGLTAFLGAHVAYVVGLNVDGGSGTAVAVSVGLVYLAGSPIAFPILHAVRTRHRSLTFPVSAYMAVISAMAASALATGRAWAAAGAVLFYASDATIAWNRFVRPLRWAPVAIMVTYHLGQAGLTASLAR